MTPDDARTRTRAASGPRLVPLSLARLAGNGLFRFVYPFLAVVAVDVGLGEGQETFLITALAVGGILLPPVSSALQGEDDAPRRSTTAGLLAMLLGTLLLGGLAPWLAAQSRLLGVAVAMVAMVVLGLAKPLLDVGSMTYVSARVDWAGRGRALSVMELTWAGGLLVLAPVGVLADRIGWRPSLVLLGLVTAATAPLLRRWLDADDTTRELVRGSTPEPPHSGGPPPQQAAAAPGTVRRSTALFLVAFGLVFVALEATFGVVGLWLEDVRGVAVAGIASLTAIGALGELTGSAFTVAVADRIGKARTAGIGLLACAAGFGLLGVAGPLWLAMTGLAIGLFGTETAIVAGIPLASEIDPDRRAAFLARAVAASSVARAAAGLVAAQLLLRGGIIANAAVSAVAALLALGLLVALLRTDERLRG